MYAHKTVITIINDQNRLSLHDITLLWLYCFQRWDYLYKKSQSVTTWTFYCFYNKCNFFANFTIRFPFGIFVSSSSVNTFNLMIAAK